MPTGKILSLELCKEKVEFYCAYLSFVSSCFFPAYLYDLEEIKLSKSFYKLFNYYSSCGLIFFVFF